MNHDDDFLFGAPETEADEPIEVNDNVEENLNAVKLDREERDKQRKEKRYFSAFKLILPITYANHLYSSVLRLISSSAILLHLLSASFGLSLSFKTAQ